MTSRGGWLKTRLRRSHRKPISSPNSTWAASARRCWRYSNRALEHPDEVAGAGWRFWTTLGRIAQFTAYRSAGRDAPPPIPAGKDKRFADRTWEDNPAFAGLRQAYLAFKQFSEDMLDAGSGDPVSDAKARLIIGFLVHAVAPTNFLATNPAA